MVLNLNQLFDFKIKNKQTEFVHFVKYLKKHSYQYNSKSYFENIKNEVYMISADFYHYTFGYTVLINALRYDESRMLLTIEIKCLLDENNFEEKEWFDEVQSELSKVSIDVFVSTFENIVVAIKCDYDCNDFEMIFEKLIKAIEYIHQSKSNLLFDLNTEKMD